MPHAVGPLLGRPRRERGGRRARPRPLPYGVGREVERAELVDADDDRGITRPGLPLAVGDVVELEDAFFLVSKWGVVAHLSGLEAFKGHALLSEQRPQALVPDVFDHPSATKNSASLDRLQVQKGRS